MTKTFRSAISILLAILVVATSAAMAAARAAPDAAGHMVLCIGDQSVVVQIDEDGQPVKPAQFCPECAMSALTGVLPVDALVDFHGGLVEVRFGRKPFQRMAQKIDAAKARGPPAPLFF